MYGVVERLENAAGAEEVHQLWWVVAGIIEALIEKGLETSVSLKRLMGQVDREMKRLRTLGEAQYAKVPPTELINNLLYYVARGRPAGPRAAAIRAAFNLSDLVPGDAQVEQARQSLSAPSVKLMQTVAQAIRDDLGRVKDVLDIFVRTGMERVEELAPQLELLKKIGDTLGVLGLGDLREVVQTRREELQDLIAHSRHPEQGALVAIAAALLNVEDRIEHDLVGMIAPHADEPTQVPLEAGQERQADLGQVTPAVMRECLVNLARVKEAVTQVTDRHGDGAGLDAVPEHLQGIIAGLMMLGRERAAGVVDGLKRAIRALVRQGPGNVDRSRLDRLADATVSLEYYLETLQAGRSDPNYMLDNAERCLAGLVAEEAPDAGAGIRIVSGADEAATVATVPPEYEPTQILPGPPRARPPALVFSGGRENLDPELLELFIEEARDEIENIGRFFPAWEQNEGERNALANLRRAFHTMKGSGRMVGADLIGEFCWLIERLLNRVINGTVRRTPELLALLQRSIDVLPALLEQLEIGAAPQEDIDALMRDVREVAEATAAATSGAEADRDEPAPAAVTPPPPPEAAPPPAAPAAAAPAAMDPVLLDIFTREVGGHLASLRKFVAACDQSAGPYAVPEELYRSCHTLNGSVAMARVEIGLPLTEALNHLVSLAYNRPARLPPGAVDTLRDTAARVEALLAYLAEPWRPVPETADLVQRLHDHAEAIEHPVVEPIEATGELPLLDIAPDETLAADGSILVEELAMPEVIELTGETAVNLSEPPPEEEAPAPTEATAFAPLPEEEVQAPMEAGAFEPPPESELTLVVEAEPATPIPESEPAIARAQTAPPAMEGPPAPAAPLPYDPEIAAIFAEEAAELLEAADGAVARIAEAHGGEVAAQAMADLQRYLHTLKGGARMAGLSIMGDFSHELETLLIRVSEGLVPRSAVINELLQASLDELHRLREDVMTAEQRPLAPQLAARLRAVVGGAQAPIEESRLASLPQQQAPVEPSVEVVEETRPAAEMPVETAAPEPPPAAPPSRVEVMPRTPIELPEISLPALDRLGELARELEQPVGAGLDAGVRNTRAAAAGYHARAPRDGARGFHAARPAAQQRRRDQHLPVAPEPAGQPHPVQPGGARRDGRPAARAAAQARARDRGADPVPPPGCLGRAHRFRSARARPLLDHPAALAQPRGIRHRREQPEGPAAEHGARHRGAARPAGTHGHGAAGRSHAHAHGAVPAARSRGWRGSCARRRSRPGKRAELQMQGGGELDRQVLERMLGPFEHMLRNAVIHGIETPAERRGRAQAHGGQHLHQPAARRLGSGRGDRRRRPRPRRPRDPPQGRGARLRRARRRGERRGGDAVHPAPRLQHRRPADAGRRPRHRDGRGHQRSREARRLAAHQLHAAVAARRSRSACRSRWPSPRRSSCAWRASSMRCRCRRSRASSASRAASSWRGSGPSSRRSSTAASSTSSVISASISGSASRASRRSRAACR